MIANLTNFLNFGNLLLVIRYWLFLLVISTLIISLLVFSLNLSDLPKIIHQYSNTNNNSPVTNN